MATIILGVPVGYTAENVELSPDKRSVKYEIHRAGTYLFGCREWRPAPDLKPRKPGDLRTSVFFQLFLRRRRYGNFQPL